MVERIGICEKHQLPLDDSGDCELCRLSDIPSRAPKARSAWWAIVIPGLVLLAATAWAYSKVQVGQDLVPATEAESSETTQ